VINICENPIATWLTLKKRKSNWILIVNSKADFVNTVKRFISKKSKFFHIFPEMFNHIMDYTIYRKAALPIVQRQKGSRSLKTTLVYLMPSTEKMAEANEKATLGS